MLGKEKRISRSYDYNNVYKNGRKTAGKYIIAFVAPNFMERNRVGFVASKKVGKAVMRNRAKRQLRAIVQNEWSGIKPGYDLVIIVRKNFPDASFDLIKKDFSIVIRRAGLC